MLVSVVVTISFLASALDLNSISEIYTNVTDSKLSKVFFFEDGNDPQYFY